jgi:hypothetical protein
MHPEIEKLIDLALADGQITEKERNIILKKAAELGVDADEVEMTLDGKLHQLEASKPKQKEKVGNIKTCPSCGASVKAFQIKCEDCGHEFRQTQSSINIKELQQKISKATSKDRPGIIQSFPIPTNKEDIIEFLTLSIPNSAPMSDTEKMGYINPWKGANVELSYREAEIASWENKSNIVLKQARILFSGDLTMTQILNNYELQLKQNLSKESKKKIKAVIPLLSIVILLIIFLTFMISGEGDDLQKEKDRLNNIELQINNAVQDKNYDKALILNEQLVWTWKLDYSESQKAALQYDEKRKSYKATIEKMKIK